MVWKETAVIALGQLICVAAMIGVFALLGKFEMNVLYGGVAGGVIALANFFFMSYFANKAADKAQEQDVAGGQKLVQLSYTFRMAAMALILVLLAKSGWVNLIALVLPLVFTRPILTIWEYIKKKGGKSV